MWLKEWMNRGSLAAVIGSSLLLSGCGTNSETEVSDKSNEPAVTIPVEAPAPALPDVNEPPMFADDNDVATKRTESIENRNTTEDLAATLKLPVPELPEIASSDDQDPPINPTDAVHHGPWLTNFAEAKKQAKAEGKDILMDFTGSNWCGYCIQLNRNVFSKDMFIKYAPTKFVLLELDFPKPAHPDPKTQEQNAALQAQFQVEGFPTIVLADAEGRPYAMTGYQPVGPDAYIRHLEELRAIKKTRDEKFAAANKAKGVARAKLLAEALDSLSGPELRMTSDQLFPAYVSVAKEIVASDADGNAGLKEVWGSRLRTSEFSQRVEKLNATVRPIIEDVPQVLNEIAKVENEFKDFEPGLQRLREFRLRVLLINKKYEEFHAESDKLLSNPKMTSGDRLEIVGRKLEVLVQTKQYTDAIKVITSSLKAHPEDKVFMTQMYLFRARVAAIQRNREEAMLALKLARNQGVEDFKKAIDEFENDILEDLDSSTPTISPKNN